jgi:hypothetical protein
MQNNRNSEEEGREEGRPKAPTFYIRIRMINVLGTYAIQHHHPIPIDRIHRFIIFIINYVHRS